jgi:hypothetical protein
VEVSILSPASGALLPWASPVTFRAPDIDAATLYCWTFTVGSATEAAPCNSSSVTQQFTMKTLGLQPGRVTIKLEAFDDDGESLGTDTISGRVQAIDVILAPADDTVFELDERIDVEARQFPSATEYCWTLAQTRSDGRSPTSVRYCSPFAERAVGESHELRQEIGVGPATLRLEIRDGSLMLGVTTIDLAFVEPLPTVLISPPLTAQNTTDPSTSTSASASTSTTGTYPTLGT